MMTDDEIFLSSLNKLMITDPDPEVLLARGLTFRRLHRFAEAINDFDTLINRGFDEVIKYRGECLLKQGKLSNAELDLSKYLLMAPKDPFALRHYAEIYRLLEDWQKASSLFGQSLLFDSKNIFALSGLADCCRNLGQLDRAFRLFNQVLEEDPFHSQALAGRAAIYQERGDAVNALEDFRIAVIEDPTNEFAGQGLKDTISEHGSF